MKGPALWCELVQGWLEHLKARGCSRATLETRTGSLRHWLRFCQMVRLARPAEATPGHLARYQRHLQRCSSRFGKRLAEGTWMMALFDLRAMVRWAVRQGLLLVDPTRDPEASQTPHEGPELPDSGGSGVAPGPARALDA